MKIKEKLNSTSLYNTLKKVDYQLNRYIKNFDKYSRMCFGKPIQDLLLNMISKLIDNIVIEKDQNIIKSIQSDFLLLNYQIRRSVDLKVLSKDLYANLIEPLEKMYTDIEKFEENN